MTPKYNIIRRNAQKDSLINAVPHHSPARVFPHLDDVSELSVACYRTDFSASRIAHAVEDAEANLLNMNVTDRVTDRGEIIIDLRVSHRSPYAVARSLERYGFYVVEFLGMNPDDDDADTLSERIGELLAHIERV